MPSRSSCMLLLNVQIICSDAIVGVTSIFMLARDFHLCVFVIVLLRDNKILDVLLVYVCV